MKCGIVLGIEDDLRDPFAVAKVDEDHAAVIAAAVHPAGEKDLPADIVFPQLAAIVSAGVLTPGFRHHILLFKRGQIYLSFN